MKSNNFELLKKEAVEVIKQVGNKEKKVLNFINILLSKINSNVSVRKNMSIASFKTLLVNSESLEEFKQFLSTIDINKDYHICDNKMLKEDIEYNEKYKNDNLEEYIEYKNHLESRVKLKENLYIIEYQ